MRKLLILAIIAALGLAACNTIKGTVHGVGKDTEKAGQWVQEKVPAPQ